MSQKNKNKTMRKDKPSRTAYKVAIGLVTLAVKPGMDAILPSGVVKATEKLLVASGVARAITVRLAASPRMVAVYEAFDWMMPGQFEALAHRKAFCERHVRAGIHAGAGQILVLGAGFDTLSWRLAQEFPDVTFFEIDHPATAAFKAKGIEAMGEPDNMVLISEDLGQQKLVDVLTGREAWNRNAKTVIVAEGLVMYLTPDAVRDLFRQCAEVTGAGSRIAFSFIPAGADGRLDAGKWTGMMLWLQKTLKEPWLWSIRPEKLDAFLAQTGWIIGPFTTGAYEKKGVEFFVTSLSFIPSKHRQHRQAELKHSNRNRDKPVAQKFRQGHDQQKNAKIDFQQPGDHRQGVADNGGPRQA